MLSADYSQIELRIMAAMSGDPAMCEAFKEGRDIHTETASRVYGIPRDQVDAVMRRAAQDSELRDYLRHFRLRALPAAGLPPQRGRHPD